MSSLEILGISGFRSYSHHTMQKIQFQKPLTLIWGKNGSGKTTIIQLLKYITTGALPPSCDKGKNFLMDPRIMGQTEVQSQARLKFKAFNQRPVMAIRRNLLTITNKGSKFQSLEQILKTRDDHNQMIEINHQCAQIQKQIPVLLGSSKAILEKIVFCHQDQSLWPFQDSSTLKNIFDELFQTKKYTLIIEGLWEQRKEYQRTINEIKKSATYKSKIYDQDKRRKIQALTDMQQIFQKTVRVKKMKQQTQNLEKQLRQHGQQTLNSKKFQLGRQRKSIEQKLSTNTQNNHKIKSALNQLQHKYQELQSKTLDDNTPKYSLQMSQKLPEVINNLEESYTKLKEQIIIAQNTQIQNQKQLELNSEIKNALEFLPEIKENILSEEQIGRKLHEKLRNLSQKKQELQILKKQVQKMDQAPTFLYDTGINQNDYRKYLQKKEQINKKIQKTQQQIFVHYYSLYQHVDNPKNIFKEHNYVHELNQVRIKLQIKKQELEEYKKLPKSTTQTTKQSIMRLRFGGVDLYQGYIDFCTSKQKCSLCSKVLSPQDIQRIVAKGRTMKQKATRQITQLQRKLAIEQQNQGVNPEILIPKRKKQIQQLQIQEKHYINMVEQEQQYNKIKQQQKLNEKLQYELRVIRLQKYINYWAQPQRKLNKIQTTFELFCQVIQNYKQLENELDQIKTVIEKFQTYSKKNSDIKIKNEELRKKRKISVDKISQLEDEVKFYDVISRISNRVDNLLAQRQKFPKKNTASKRKAALNDLHLQLQQTQLNLKSTKIQQQFHQQVVILHQLSSQKIELQKEIINIDKELTKIDQDRKLLITKKQKYSRIKIEYEKCQKQIDLRTEITFQEHNRACQKQFILERKKYLQAQRASKQIQICCAALENSISSMHKQKMDLVNKILHDVWRQTYHQSDISSIQIETRFDQDSKKRKNYHYSIMMQKTGNNSTKVQMKGRCSMGQKVLASIVIRLALAQVFSTSARILALDEPTTFLDREHIIKLAEQLCQLIEMNGEGGSLQLIIISHDLEFIKMLEKYTKVFYEVTRNPRQFSIITQREIQQSIGKNNVT